MSCCECCTNRCDEGDSLSCIVCNRIFHLKCLRNGGPPGGLLGDVFFTFVCVTCSSSGAEHFRRGKMPWITVIILSLFNLHERMEGTSRRGYFHWKFHICNFIDKHRSTLFGSTAKKRKNWMGTVSGTLSHYSPIYFCSGLEELGESGWWRLAQKQWPKLLLKHKLHAKQQNKTMINMPLQIEPGDSKEDIDVEYNWSDQCVDIDQNTKSVSVKIEPKDSKEDEEVVVDWSESLDVNNCQEGITLKKEDNGMQDGWDDQHLDIMGPPPFYLPSDITGMDPLQVFADGSLTLMPDEQLVAHEVTVGDSGVDCLASAGLESEPSLNTQIDDWPQLAMSPSSGLFIDSHEMMNMELDSLSNWVEGSITEEPLSVTEEPANTREKPVEEVADHSAPMESLFSRGIGVKEQWADESATEPAESKKCWPMSEYDEHQLRCQLARVSSLPTVPGHVRRLYRKLCVRELKRQRGLKLLDVDAEVCRSAHLPAPPSTARLVATSEKARVLDRFQVCTSKMECRARDDRPFRVCLTGQYEEAPLYSPYTKRMLKLYIWRDKETIPPWLKLMRELLVKANSKIPGWKVPPHASLDYCYLRSQHVPAINSLCCQFFYPGIDVTECLHYPDFTCVVLYKKLIVAFGLMVPDTGFNQSYISFLFTRPEWRQAGIASVILYHLIQMAAGKDVTLHVSATNPAVLLYQKFGFKVEEFVQDFYEKYFPADSDQCKHALYLRLGR